MPQSKRLVRHREVVEETKSTTTTPESTRTETVTTTTTVDTYHVLGQTEPVTETTTVTWRLVDTVYTYDHEPVPAPLGEGKSLREHKESSPPDEEEQDLLCGVPRDGDDDSDPPTPRRFRLEPARLGHAVAWRLPLDDDPDVPRAIREHVRARVAPPLFMRHVAQFQAQDLELGRDAAPVAGRRAPARAQRAAREWFRQREPSLNQEVHVDHIVPYGQGGAHCSSNATLLLRGANLRRCKTLVFRDLFLAGSVREASRALWVSRTRGNATHPHPRLTLPIPVGYDGPVPTLAEDASVERIEMALRTVLRYLQLPEVRLTDGDVSIHPECRLVRRGDVRFLEGIRIDPTSPAVRSNHVRLRRGGCLNRTCSAVKAARRDRE